MLNTFNLSNLPEDMLEIILFNLTPQEIADMRLVSNQFRERIEGNHGFWKKKLEIDIPIAFSALKDKNIKNWYAQFCEAFEENKKNNNNNIEYKKIVDGCTALTDSQKASSSTHMGRYLIISAIIYKQRIHVIKELVDKEIYSREDERIKEMGFYLQWAVEYGHKRAVQFFLDQGADINFVSESLSLNSPDQVESARAKRNGTPLFLAVMYSRSHIVDLILEKKPDINIRLASDFCYNRFLQAKKGDTPLHVAIELGSIYNLDFVKKLIENGADISIQTKEGLDAFQLAAKCRQLDILKYLIEKPGVNARFTNGETALHIAIKYNYLEFIDFLLQNGVDLHLSPHTSASFEDNLKPGDTPLHYASRLGKVAIIEKLIEAGADTQIRNSQGERPIDLLPKAFLNPDDKFNGLRKSLMLFKLPASVYIEGKYGTEMIKMQEFDKKPPVLHKP